VRRPRIELGPHTARLTIGGGEVVFEPGEKPTELDQLRAMAALAHEYLSGRPEPARNEASGETDKNTET
jgi:hypothetical protein